MGQLAPPICRLNLKEFNMARRRNDFDSLGPIMQIGLLLAFAYAFLPPFRTVLLYAAIFGLAVLVLVLLVRVALTSEQRPRKIEDPVANPPARAQLAQFSWKSNSYMIGELIEQSR